MFEILKQEPILFGILTGFFLLFCWSIPTFMLTLRPLRGTTEWIKRIGDQPCQLLTVKKFALKDAIFAVVTGILSLLLRYVMVFLTVEIRSDSSGLKVIGSIGEILFWQLLPCTLIGISMYLLLRYMFSSSISAVFGGLLCALGQGSEFMATSALVLSLLFLYIWAKGDPEAPLFFHAFWFVVSVGLFLFGLLFCWSMFWTVPLYIAVYVIVQIRRWKYGIKEQRVKKLIASILYLIPLGILSIVLLWVGYFLFSGLGEGETIQVLTASKRIFVRFFDFFGYALSYLVEPVHFFHTIQVRDVFLLVGGGAAWLCALYTAIRFRDSLSIILICAAVLFIPTWLIGGAYMMTIPVAALICYTWNIYAQRKKSVFMVISIISMFFGTFIPLFI